MLFKSLVTKTSLLESTAFTKCTTYSSVSAQHVQPVKTLHVASAPSTVHFGATAAHRSLHRHQQQQHNSARASLLTTPKAAPTDVFALDLDGVIADSQNEVCSAGFETAKRRWPGLFNTLAPSEQQRIQNGLLRCRPRLVKGPEMTIMARMILESNDAVEQILTVENWELSGGLVEQTIQRWNEDYVSILADFETYRNWVIESDTPAWVAMSPLYDGVKDAFQDCPYPIYFVSSKKEDRVVKLLNGHLNLNLAEGASPQVMASLQPPNEKKIAALRSIMQRPLAQDPSVSLHFVDDRFETLKAVCAQPDLVQRWNIYFASWGYVTDEEMEEAKSVQGLRVIKLEEFCELLRFGLIMQVDDGCQDTEEEALAGVYKPPNSI